MSDKLVTVIEKGVRRTYSAMPPPPLVIVHGLPLIDFAPAGAKPACPVVVKPRKNASPWHKFLRSSEWKALRAMVLARYGAICMACGQDSLIQVDHIKPKSTHPHLALDESNLQVLCWPCNKLKWANGDETDYRLCK